MNAHNIMFYGILAIIAISVFASFNYAFALDCYDRFVFNWFTANDVLECLNNSGGGGGNNTAICHAQTGGEDLCNVANELKNLVGDDYINMAQNETHIVLSTDSILAVCSETLAEGELCNSDENHVLRDLVAGTGISITSNATHIVITNSSPDNTTCANVGAGAQVYKDGECNFRTFISSNSAIGITQNTNDITFNPKWELLCQNSLGVSATSISCSDFSVRKYIIVHAELKIVTNSVGIAYRFNSDSGTNYSWRQSINGGADTTGTNDTECTLSSTSANGGANIFLVINNNLSTDRKLSNTLWGAGIHDNSATAPSRIENVCKWDNTSNAISTIAFIRESGTGEYNTNTRLTVWGYD